MPGVFSRLAFFHFSYRLARQINPSDVSFDFFGRQAGGDTRLVTNSNLGLLALTLVGTSLLIGIVLVNSTVILSAIILRVFIIIGPRRLQ